MTRKDFVLIADALRNAKPSDLSVTGAYAVQHKADCEEIANALARTNSRFDRERFLKACGVQS